MHAYSRYYALTKTAMTYFIFSKHASCRHCTYKWGQKHREKNLLVICVAIKKELMILTSIS